MNERASMQPVGTWRAYFAPVDRASGTATKLDAPQVFDVEAPPAPWTEVGWIRNLKRSSAVELESVATGTAGVPSLRFRKRCEARVEFDFCEWGKLQMALAAASQHINMLDGEPVAVLSGSASELLISPEGLAAFAAGDLISVDVDHGLASGYVGTGVSGAFVKDPSKAGADYVRATSYNVSKVKEKTATSLVLERPLIGGAPLDGAKAQKVVAYADREGASFLQEWSALFVMDEVAGGRLMLWFPRLQTAAEAGETRESVDAELEQDLLHANFVALPTVDAMDGEMAVAYRFYVPAAAAAVY